MALGFTLHRRGVSFDNYARAYHEGLMGVFKHKYYDQAHVTMTKLRNIYKQKATNKDEQLPVFSHSLLAAADEFGHLHGITADNIKFTENSTEVIHCFKRKKIRMVDHFGYVKENGSQTTDKNIQKNG